MEKETSSGFAEETFTEVCAGDKAQPHKPDIHMKINSVNSGFFILYQPLTKDNPCHSVPGFQAPYQEAFLILPLLWVLREFRL